jgi:flagellar biosynthesis/type III secretory pathway protein FliH
MSVIQLGSDLAKLSVNDVNLKEAQKAVLEKANAAVRHEMLGNNPTYLAGFNDGYEIGYNQAQEDYGSPDDKDTNCYEKANEFHHELIDKLHNFAEEICKELNEW